MTKKNTFNIIIILFLYLVCCLSISAQTNAEKEKLATKIFEEARSLAISFTPEKRKEAIPKFEQARKLFNELKNQKYEALCLSYLGNLNNGLGNKKVALEYYKQSVPLFRAVGDTLGEEMMTAQINIVSNDLGEQIISTDGTLYSDSEYKFSIKYPLEWIKGDTIQPENRLVLQHPDSATFVLKAVKLERAKDLTSSDYVNTFINNPDALAKFITERFPNQKLVTMGKTKISEQDVLQLITQKTIKVQDSSYETKMYYLAMLHNEVYYEFLFGCMKEDFDRNLPIFKSIASSFKLN